MDPFLNWLLTGALGPAVFGLPVAWTASALTEKARRWVHRLKRTSDLGQIIAEVVEGEAKLSDAESAAVLGLLENAATWEQVPHGTVEDLAVRIAGQLPAWNREKALAIGRAIAAAFIQYVLTDLEPGLFQRAMLARLDRLEARGASGLDRVLLTADVAALLVRKDVADEDRFASLLDRLSRLLDRLPPGPAGLGEVAVYLTRLARWLDADPWPQDRWLGGPALVPSQIESRLRVTDSQASQGKRDRDADELSDHCTRLVILGGPGTGKTWLARRAARRCALAAMSKLADGAALDEVELPLYTTCARLAAMPPGDGIRAAVVRAALDQLPDLGGSRTLTAVRALFEDRDASTLVVFDSLDEAAGPDERIRLADTLPQAWRIILTSRPASWQHQLGIDGKDKDTGRRLVELQPLRYPDDIEPFISSWFTGQPEQARALIKQLRDRPTLQKSSVVPLVLAFYCIISADQPLPANRAAVYAKVILRMLTGRWRGVRSSSDSVEHLGTLREWAWSTAASDPVSGIGAWKDDFPARLTEPGASGQEALDHVAVPLPLEPADVDSGVTRRRFVHRVLQEHLVAEYVARMPAAEAADELLKHLWYDQDWEYAAPAALAMHPERSQVLMTLMRLVAGGVPFSHLLADMDGCWELRRFLARVALESREDDAWSPDATHIIQQARLDVAEHCDPRSLELIMTGEWPTSNRLIIKSLLAKLPEACLHRWGDKLAEALGALDPDQEELASGRAALLALLPDATFRPWRLIRAAAKLGPTNEEMKQSRQALLGALSGNLDHLDMCMTVKLIIELNPTAEENARAARAVLARLASEWHPYYAIELATIVTQLGLAPEDLAAARKSLLALLEKNFDSEPSWNDPSVSWRVQAVENVRIIGQQALELTEAIAALEPTVEDLKEARRMVLAWAARETDNPRIRLYVTDVVVQFKLSEKEAMPLRKTLFTQLMNEPKNSEIVEYLGTAIAKLNPTPQELSQLREVVLEWPASEGDRIMWPYSVRILPDLAPTPEDLAHARHNVLSLLLQTQSFYEIDYLAETLLMLGPTPGELTRARNSVLARVRALTGDRPGIDRLPDALKALAAASDDLARTRRAVLAAFDSQVNSLGPATSLATLEEFAQAVSKLAPTAEEMGRVRELIFALFLSTDHRLPRLLDMVKWIPILSPTAAEMARFREALITCADSHSTAEIAQALITLGPTSRDLLRVKDQLLARLHTASQFGAHDLLEALAMLAPTITDLMNANTWPLAPTPALLSAARKSSELDSWLTSLPMLNLDDADI